jgi:hypothetical protein
VIRIEIKSAILTFAYRNSSGKRANNLGAAQQKLDMADCAPALFAKRTHGRSSTGPNIERFAQCNPATQ